LNETRQAIAEKAGTGDHPILLEEAIAIAQEIYLAVRVDGTRQCLEMLVAPHGGEDVERAGDVLRIPLDPLSPTTANTLYPALKTLFAHDVASRLARYAARLPDIARREDLELLEINPLALTADGRFVACDAKVIRDDSADFRHDADEFALSRVLETRAMTALEREAQDLGFQLVEIEGDVALVTSGAGLGMMMIDLLADHGLKAACFMDNLRGAPDETMSERLSIARKIAQRPHVKAIVFLTVLSSRSLAERIEALLAWLAAEPLPKPLFVGIAAGHAAARRMSAEAAVAKLAEVGISAFTDPVLLASATAAAVGAKR
jgi:succinyl-CoA synthetase beta subunit